MHAFHLSFVVANLEQTKNFYLETLGCQLGRDSGGWIDILFFGHQLTIHQESDAMSAQAIDHFGLILNQPVWQSTLAKCKRLGAQFVMQALIKNNNESNESGKFIIQDPAGNILEFKYYSSGLPSSL